MRTIDAKKKGVSCASLKAAPGQRFEEKVASQAGCDSGLRQLPPVGAEGRDGRAALEHGDHPAAGPVRGELPGRDQPGRGVRGAPAAAVPPGAERGEGAEAHGDDVAGLQAAAAPGKGYQTCTPVLEGTLAELH